MGPLSGMRTRSPPLPSISQSPEKTETGQEESCPFSSEQSSHVFSSLLSWQVKLRENVRSASYPLSQNCSVPYNGVTLASFSWALGISWFFSHSSPLIQYLSTGWVIPLASFSQPPHPGSFAWVGISQYLSAEPHSVSRPWMGGPWMFHLGPPLVSFLLGGGR